MTREDLQEGDSPWLPYELQSREALLDPYPFFRREREAGPVRFDERREVFDVFGYDAVVEAASDYERFTKRGASLIDGSVLSRDPPMHTELRASAEDYFRPGYLRKYEPNVEARVEAILDDALAGNGEIAFVEAIAKQVPILIIADIMGIPPERLDTFRKWSTTMAAAPEEPTLEAREKLSERQAKAMEELGAFFTSEIEKREANPRDDLITKLVQAEQNSDMIDRSNTLAQCQMLLIAGNVTTTQLLTNALWTFVEEAVIEDLQEERLDLRDAINEVLRYRSPVMPAKRIVKKDTELAGVEMPKAARMVNWYIAANRDPAVFENPNEFDPNRDNLAKHLGFGKGIHYCLGAPLAKIEAEITLRMLLERTDDIEITTDRLEPFFSPELYGPKSLTIRVV